MIPLILFIAGLVVLLVAILPITARVNLIALGLFFVFLAQFLVSVVGLTYP